jgi:hypothetical protein
MYKIGQLLIRWNNGEKNHPPKIFGILEYDFPEDDRDTSFILTNINEKDNNKYIVTFATLYANYHELFGDNPKYQMRDRVTYDGRQYTIKYVFQYPETIVWKYFITNKLIVDENQLELSDE